MKVLSIRQPWAWLIIHGGKDIENRTWPTKFRGHFLVHASKGMTRKEYIEVLDYIEKRIDVNPEFAGVYNRLPLFEELELGGIIGEVTLVDCVIKSDSPWFFGTYGFVLKDVKPLMFTPLKGMLGFFERK
jgi:hypothetical protein